MCDIVVECITEREVNKMKKQMATVNYNGTEIETRGGAWLDIMNSFAYTVIAETGRYNICKECGNGKIFALPTVQ